MSTRIQNRAMRAIEPLWARGPWLEGAWEPRPRRAAAAMLGSLREELGGHPPMVAVAAAFAASRQESGGGAAAWHELWFRVTLVWFVREVVRAAHAEPEFALREALLSLAAECATAAVRLPHEPGPEASLEPLIEASREAFALARDGIDPGAPEAPVLALMLGQFRHTAGLLVVGGHPVDNLLRGSLTRSDRAARREALGAWGDGPLAVRQCLAQRGLIEAAWALAARVPATKFAGSAGVALWLGRTATQFAARLDRAPGWVPVVPEDAARHLAAGTAPLPAIFTDPRARLHDPVFIADNQSVTHTPFRERSMENHKLGPVLKTLENDAGDAAWRLAGSQFVKLAKEPLVALLSRQLSPNDESFRARLATFLDTEMGAAILASLLSVGLSALPLPNADVTQRLARELRVRAMAGAGDVLADVLMGPLRQVAAMYLQGVPTGTAAAADPAALPGVQVIDALRTAAAVTERAPAEA